MDRHLNIFYSYRQGNFEDAEGERVLEDNVTRALIIVLQSSDLLTQEFLKEFTGVNPDAPYDYDLQSKNESDDLEADRPRRPRGKCVVVVAEHPEIPNSLPVPDVAMREFESHVENNRSRLRSDLARLSDQVRKGGLRREDVHNRLKQLLELNDTDVDRGDLSDPALPFYLYQLTFGSRPDAWITSPSSRFIALFENKLHAGISDAQIRRHIRENFEGGLQPKYFLREKNIEVERSQVPVVLWSWRDVCAFFSRFRDEQPLSIDPESYYIVRQFLDYLEVVGMSEVKFTQDDFLNTWEPYTDMGEVGMLLDRVEALGEELEAELGEHFTVRQNRSRGYLGVNVMCNDFNPIDGTKGGKGIRSEQVPHWSCGLQGRFLRLYIQCESKPLVEKLVKQRDRLIPSMTEALWEAHGLPGLRLRVQEKLHIVAGGKGKNSPVWSEFAAFSAGAIPEQRSPGLCRPPSIRCDGPLTQLRGDKEEG